MWPCSVFLLLASVTWPGRYCMLLRHAVALIPATPSGTGPRLFRLRGVKNTHADVTTVSVLLV